jgi:hypothetical protein
MSLLARARQKRPELGYTPDFVSAVMEPLASEIARRGIKVIANAGGVNPYGCRSRSVTSARRRWSCSRARSHPPSPRWHPV